MFGLAASLAVLLLSVACDSGEVYSAAEIEAAIEDPFVGANRSPIRWIGDPCGSHTVWR